MLLDLGLKLGVFSSLREGGLYTPKEGQPGDAWNGVEVRYISCERSVWEMPWGTSLLRKEIEAAQEQSLPMRTIRFVFVKGANHFVSFDLSSSHGRRLISLTVMFARYTGINPSWRYVLL